MIRDRTGGPGSVIVLFVLIAALLLIAMQSNIISIPTTTPVQTGISLQPLQNAADNVVISVSSATGIGTVFIIIVIMAAIIAVNIRKQR